MKLNNTIILQGPGRSGTTFLNKILSFHNQVGFLSGYNNRFPESNLLSILNRLYKVETLNIKFRNNKLFPKPAEAYEFWEYYFTNFRDRPFDFSIKEEHTLTCIRNLEQISSLQKTDKLLIKITGSSRAEWVSKLFNKPKVIWLERDPRAVVSSFDKQNWLFKNNLQEKSIESKNVLIEKYIELYMNFYESGKDLEERKIFYYEDLVKEPNKFLSSILSYCDLEPDKSFFDFLKTWQIKDSTNDAWKSKYNHSEIELLNNKLRKPLIELGYS